MESEVLKTLNAVPDIWTGKYVGDGGAGKNISWGGGNLKLKMREGFALSTFLVPPPVSF